MRHDEMANASRVNESRADNQKTGCKRTGGASMTVRRARRLVAFPILGLGLLSLAACGGLGGHKSRPSTPIFGKREPILNRADIVKADPTLATLPVTLPEPLANADWPQPGGDADKEIGPVALGTADQVAWTARIKGSSPRARLASSPVVGGGTLFAIDAEATVHAFDAKTGADLWETSIRSGDENSHVEFGGGVSVEGDRVFADNGIGDVVALDAKTGKKVWDVRPGGPLRGAPTLSNGQVYVMSQDNQLFALSQKDGAVIWSDAGTLEATGIFGVAAPSAGQGSVLAGYSSGELSAYRYENGRALWGDTLSRTSIATSVATLTDVDADPVIDRGRVFAIGEGGRMASYELVTGQRLWELNIGGTATPFVAGDWVFVVTEKAKLFCIQRTTGKVRWISQLTEFRHAKKKTGPVRWFGPIIGGDRLILVSTEGEMAFVDVATGKITSQRKIKQPMSLAPIIAGGMLYVLTDDGRIIAYH